MFISKDLAYLVNHLLEELSFMLAQKVEFITSPTEELKFIVDETFTIKIIFMLKSKEFIFFNV